MLKICDDTICKPLEMIIKGLSLFRFHLNGKKDTVPIHKPPPPPPNRENLKNFRPVFLLRIRGKNFERLIFNKMFIFLETYFQQRV